MKTYEIKWIKGTYALLVARPKREKEVNKLTLVSLGSRKGKICYVVGVKGNYFHLVCLEGGKW